MMEDEIQQLRDQAHQAMRNKNYKRAMDYYEQLAQRDVPDGMLMCGVIHENQWDETLTNLDKAYEFYRKLAIKWNADLGYLGCVRVILAKGDVSSRDTALGYCRELIEGEESRYGYLTMGRTYEELFDPPEVELARAAYFRSFLHGSTWGLRKYATSLINSRKYVRGVAMHVVATIVSPFLLLFGGLGATRRDG